MVNNAYNKNGATMVGGKKYQLTVGSRAQVWNGTAYKTGYGKKGLKRSDLIRNKHGRIVSKKKHAYGKSKVLNNYMLKVISPVKVISELLKRVKPQRKVAKKVNQEVKDADTNQVKRKVNIRNVKPRKDVK